MKGGELLQGRNVPILKPMPIVNEANQKKPPAHGVEDQKENRCNPSRNGERPAAPIPTLFRPAVMTVVMAILHAA